MTEAKSSVGVKFKRGNGEQVETFTAIAEVLRASGPGMTRDFIDCTNLDSTGGYREFIAGFRDGGEFTFSMNWTYDGYVAMKEDFESDDEINYQIVVPGDDGITLQFAGLVTNLPLNVDTGSQITCDATIKITGYVEEVSV